MQVLRLLSQAYLLNGNAARAHACVLDARSLLDPIADSPDLCLTAIQALVKVWRCLSHRLHALA